MCETGYHALWARAGSLPIACVTELEFLLRPMPVTNAPSESTPASRPQRPSPTALALRLIEPAVPLPEAVRLQARLLSVLLIALLLLIVLGIGTFYAALASRNPLPGLTFPITAFGAALLVLAYGLNRQGRYALAAGLTIAVTAVGVWAAVIANRDGIAGNPLIILYVLLSVLLSSLLLSPRATAFIAAAHLLGILAAPAFVPGFTSAILVNSLLFVSFTALVTVVGGALRHRSLVQLDAQAGALRESEQRFRVLFAASPDAVLLIDPHDPRADWPIVDCNAAACQMNGFTRAELLGQSVDILNASPGNPPERAAYLERLRREPVVHLETSRKHKTGTVFPIEVSTSVIILAGREMVLGIDRDITERKRVELALRESEAHQRALFEDSPVSLWEEDFSAVKQRLAALRQEGVEDIAAYLTAHPETVAECASLVKVTDVNRATLKLYGAASQADLLQNLGRIFGGVTLNAFREELVQIAQGRTEFEREGLNQTLTGELLHIGLRWSAVPGYADTLAKVLVSITDITARRRAEETLHATNAQLTTWVSELEERTREMAILNDMVSLFQTCRAPEEAYGIVGKMAPGLFAGQGGALAIVHPSRNLVETVANWGDPNCVANVFQVDDCWALRRAQPHLVLDSQSGLTCQHLTVVPPAYICVPLFAQGDVLGCFHVNAGAGQLSDQKQQLAKTVADAIALSLANLRLRESLRQQSIIDLLTGLFNRRYMEETLEREVRRCARAQRPLSVILLDLDRFKTFNDTHGHAAGDVLLGALGSFLRSHVRAEDIACRYGGEEFTLILPDSSLEAAAQRAELLRVGVNTLRVEYGGRIIGPVTISLGVASFPEHGPSGTVALRVADEALYRAKHEGRDRVVVATLPAT